MARPLATRVQIGEVEGGSDIMCEAAYAIESDHVEKEQGLDRSQLNLAYFLLVILDIGWSLGTAILGIVLGDVLGTPFLDAVILGGWTEGDVASVNRHS